MANDDHAITIDRMDNGVYRLSAKLWLPLPPEQVFDFFSDAHNLESITPPWMKFEVLTPRPIDMHEGALIDYRLKVRGLPIKWRTKITKWHPPHAFEDSQLRGPYRQWDHTHTFHPLDGGTLAGDQVHYRVPGGALIHWLLVKRDVIKIFEYRQQKLAAHFQQVAASGSTTPAPQAQAES